MPTAGESISSEYPVTRTDGELTDIADHTFWPVVMDRFDTITTLE